MALAPGTRLGAYEIVGLLGAGGMGEVYRAVDRRLDRPAAIKVLPDAFRSDPERTARFEREAKLLASLNHPNIAAIYGLEQGDGQQFIVMELVEGETLAERIARGRIPVPEALEIAQQIAAALEAAHDKGVIHRDLKPANVKLTPDDQVKVLDFGLAKALDPATGSPPSSPWLSNSPTINSPAGATGLGVLLGTAAYMSPEQARGKTVDKRSDIWAFGCVLFEMLTGRRAFDGEDVQSTLAAILRDTPDSSILPKETPPAVKTIVARCLEKDPKRRIPDIAVVRFLLDDLATLTGRLSEPATPGRLLRRHWVAATATIVVSLAVLGGIAGLLLDSQVARTRQTIRFEVAPPAAAVLAARPEFATSPDGRWLAYVAAVGSRNRLFVRPLDTVVSRELPGTDAAAFPFWSPDSRTMGFFADGKLKKVDLEGSQPQTLADVPQTLGATWSKDGFILFGAFGAGLQRVSSQSGGVPVQATVLTEGEGGHIDPTFLPDGRHFFYRVVSDDLSPGAWYVGSVDSPERSRIFERPEASSVTYSAGYLLYVRQGSLVAQPFDVAQLVLSGEPEIVVENIQTVRSLGAFSVSEKILAYRTAATLSATLTWFDREGRPLGSLGDPAEYGDVELSPDEKRVAVSIFDPSRRTRDIWLVDVARGMRNRFTFGPGEKMNASWSPDSSRIVFNSQRGPNLDLYERPSDMSRPEELLFSDNRRKFPFRWTPDGRFLSYISIGSNTQTGIWVLPMGGVPSAAQQRKPDVYLDTEFMEEFPQLSSDGRWMAYKSNESKTDQVFVESFPERQARVQVSIAGGSWPRWRDDNRELFFLSPDNMLMSAAVTTSNSAVEVGEVRRLFRAPMRQSARTWTFAYDVAADGQRFLFIAPSKESANSPITIAVDWLEELRNPRRN